MDNTIILLLILLIINIVQFITIYKLTQNSNNANTDFSEIYQKQIKNYNNIIRLTERLTKEIMNKAKKEEQNNEKVEESKQQQDMVQVSEQRRIY